MTAHVQDSLKFSVIVAGDFNMDEKKPVFDSFKKAGFTTAISNQKTTLKRNCSKKNYLNYAIDNVFCSQEIRKVEGGVIDFVRFCEDLEKARKLSDHLPVFLRFDIR